MVFPISKPFGLGFRTFFSNSKSFKLNSKNKVQFYIHMTDSAMLKIALHGCKVLNKLKHVSTKFNN